MQLGGTAEQQLGFLNTHWGREYRLTAPGLPDGNWTATAKFGDHDTLKARSASELLEMVRAHYQASKPMDDDQTQGADV
jgi:hypothetical protein